MLFIQWTSLCCVGGPPLLLVYPPLEQHSLSLVTILLQVPSQYWPMLQCPAISLVGTCAAPARPGRYAMTPGRDSSPAWLSTGRSAGWRLGHAPGWCSAGTCGSGCPSIRSNTHQVVGLGGSPCTQVNSRGWWLPSIGTMRWPCWTLRLARDRRRCGPVRLRPCLTARYVSSDQFSLTLLRFLVSLLVSFFFFFFLWTLALCLQCFS